MPASVAGARAPVSREAARDKTMLPNQALKHKDFGAPPLTQLSFMSTRPSHLNLKYVSYFRVIVM